jgi:hypothetical protein
MPVRQLRGSSDPSACLRTKTFEHFRLAHLALPISRANLRQAKNGMRTMNMMIAMRSAAIKLPPAARDTGAHRAAAPIVCRPCHAFPR